MHWVSSNEGLQIYKPLLTIIGLVPKDQDQTRMIFRLSYDFKHNKSINFHTPRELCETHYNEFDEAVRLCIKAGRGAFMARSDLK